MEGLTQGLFCLLYFVVSFLLHVAVFFCAVWAVWAVSRWPNSPSKIMSPQMTSYLENFEVQPHLKWGYIDVYWRKNLKTLKWTTWPMYRKNETSSLKRESRLQRARQGSLSLVHNNHLSGSVSDIWCSVYMTNQNPVFSSIDQSDSRYWD